MVKRVSQISADALLNNWQKLRVLVIGDVMLDAYWHGSVDRISPEAPVPIVSVKKHEHRLGGAANVAVNILALGAEPVLIAVRGTDAEGDLLSSLLYKAGVNFTGLVSDPSRPTTIKTRVISGSQQLLRLDQESDRYVNTEISTSLKNKIDSLLPTTNVVIIEDYDKGLLTPDIIQYLINKATEFSIPIVVDPKKRQFWDYKNVTLFKPNLKELKEGLGLLQLPILHPNYDALVEAAKNAQKKLNAKNLLVTLSEHGAFYASETEWGIEPAFIRKISDVSGAGDTVVSVAALCLAANLNIDLLTKLANLAGGLVCELPGVSPINKTDFFAEAIRLNVLD